MTGETPDPISAWAAVVVARAELDTVEAWARQELDSAEDELRRRGQ